ncbi:hypothetical protein C2W58_01905 [Bacillus pumilus]|nr:hypothetical protein C2W58_01905 [Bacillus pumilus]
MILIFTMVYVLIGVFILLYLMKTDPYSPIILYFAPAIILAYPFLLLKSLLRFYRLKNK